MRWKRDGACWLSEASIHVCEDRRRDRRAAAMTSASFHSSRAEGKANRMLVHPDPAYTLLLQRYHASLLLLLLHHQTTNIPFPSYAARMTLLVDIAQAAQDRPVLAFAIIVSILFAVLAVTASAQKYPQDVPWIGRDDSKSFAITRATFSSINNVNKWLAEGYQKVGYSSYSHCLQELCADLPPL